MVTPPGGRNYAHASSLRNRDRGAVTAVGAWLCDDGGA